jgi:hypothetical protein
METDRFFAVIATGRECKIVLQDDFNQEVFIK